MYWANQWDRFLSEHWRSMLQLKTVLLFQCEPNAAYWTSLLLSLGWKEILIGFYLFGCSWGTHFTHNPHGAEVAWADPWLLYAMSSVMQMCRRRWGQQGWAHRLPETKRHTILCRILCRRKNNSSPTRHLLRSTKDVKASCFPFSGGSHQRLMRKYAVLLLLPQGTIA